MRNQNLARNSSPEPNSSPFSCSFISSLFPAISLAITGTPSASAYIIAPLMPSELLEFTRQQACESKQRNCRLGRAGRTSGPPPMMRVGILQSFSIRESQALRNVIFLTGLLQAEMRMNLRTEVHFAISMSTRSFYSLLRSILASTAWGICRQCTPSSYSLALNPCDRAMTRQAFLTYCKHTEQFQLRSVPAASRKTLSAERSASLRRGGASLQLMTKTHLTLKSRRRFQISWTQAYQSREGQRVRVLNPSFQIWLLYRSTSVRLPHPFTILLYRSTVSSRLSLLSSQNPFELPPPALKVQHSRSLAQSLPNPSVARGSKPGCTIHSTRLSVSASYCRVGGWNMPLNLGQIILLRLAYGMQLRASSETRQQKGFFELEISWGILNLQMPAEVATAQRVLKTVGMTCTWLWELMNTGRCPVSLLNRAICRVISYSIQFQISQKKLFYFDQNSCLPKNSPPRTRALW